MPSLYFCKVNNHVTSKPANGIGRPGLRMFYPAASCGGKSVLVRQLRGPHLSTWPWCSKRSSMALTAAASPSSLPQSSSGRFEVSMVLRSEIASRIRHSIPSLFGKAHNRSLGAPLAHIEGSTYLRPRKPFTPERSHPNSIYLDARLPNFLPLARALRSPALTRS